LGAIVQALGAELDLPVRWPGEGPQLRWLVHPRAAVKTAAVGALARALRPRSGARVRVWGAFEAGRLSERRLVRIVRGLGAGEHELVVHPGLSPGVVPQDPRWKYEWEGELGAVLSPRVRDVVRARGVELVSHRGLRSEAVGSGSPP
jgi:hypothetical protein